MQDNSRNLENKGWDQMSHLLDKEMPQSKKRRGFVWYWWGIGAALIIGMIITANIFISMDQTDVQHVSAPLVDNDISMDSAQEDIITSSSPANISAIDKTPISSNQSATKSNESIKNTNKKANTSSTQISTKSSAKTINKRATNANNKSTQKASNSIIIRTPTNNLPFISSPQKEDETINEDNMVNDFTVVSLRVDEAYRNVGQVKRSELPVFAAMSSSTIELLSVSDEELLLDYDLGAVPVKISTPKPLIDYNIRLGSDIQLNDINRNGLMAALRFNTNGRHLSAYVEAGIKHSFFNGVKSLSQNVNIDVIDANTTTETTDNTIVDEQGNPIATYDLETPQLDITSRTDFFTRFGIKKNFHKQFYAHFYGDMGYLIRLRNTNIEFVALDERFASTISENNLNTRAVESSLNKNINFGYGLGLGYEINDRWSLEINTNGQSNLDFSNSILSNASSDDGEIFSPEGFDPARPFFDIEQASNNQRLFDNLALNVLWKF